MKALYEGDWKPPSQGKRLSGHTTSPPRGNRPKKTHYMSSITFDGNTHTLTLFDSENKQVGQWHANNVTDRAKSKFKFVPNGEFRFKDMNLSYRHKEPGSDTVNGKYGSFGILRLNPFTVDRISHDGVGIHSGRANRRGPEHATQGCIRTTDTAMEAITSHIVIDPLTTLKVQNNHDQYNPHPHIVGDTHHAP